MKNGIQSYFDLLIGIFNQSRGGQQTGTSTLFRASDTFLTLVELVISSGFLSKTL